jgi:hypothetical protein
MFLKKSLVQLIWEAKLGIQCLGLNPSFHALHRSLGIFALVHTIHKRNKECVHCCRDMCSRCCDMSANPV